VNSLNPAAGVVAVPEDPREIEAALRAGRISYRLFPYMEWRYGERGRRFTRSDSAWLAWLTRHHQERVRQQIAWLKSVLSNRGMPSSILELHLEVLQRQLVRAVPEKAQQYATLKFSAGWLRQEREAGISGQTAARLVDDCVADFSLPQSVVLRGAAELLVAAIADQNSGVENAIESVESWLADVATLRTVDGLRERLSSAERRLLDSKSFEKEWPAKVAATIAESGVNKTRAEIT